MHIHIRFSTFLQVPAVQRRFDMVVSVSLLRDDYLGFHETRNAIALIVCSLYDSGLGVECRLVRRNMIPWTFLAYIATHYMIESKRTSGHVSMERQETMGHAAGHSHRGYRSVRCIVHPPLRPSAARMFRGSE